MKITVHINPILSFLWFVFFFINTSITVSTALHSECFHCRPCSDCVSEFLYFCTKWSQKVGLSLISKKWGVWTPCSL